MPAHSDGDRLPTAPAHAARLRVYQPTERPANRQGEWIETRWGAVRVEGKLGQRHADVVEAAHWCAKQKYKEADGRMQLLVDPYRLRKTLSKTGYSYTGLWNRLREIMTAVVEFQANAGHKGLGHIIESVVEAQVDAPDPLRPGHRRRLWKITLGAAWVRLIENDIALRYDPGDIARLQHGISKAAGRMMLGHKPSTLIKIDTLFDWLQVPNGKARRNRRHRLNADADALATAGVIVNNGSVSYRPELATDK